MVVPIGVGETFGEMLRRLRGSRSLSAIGHLANISKGHVHDLENARRAPSRSVVVRLDEILRANGELIEAYESRATLPEEVRPGMAEKICLRTLKTKALQESEEEATERRRLLRLAAGAGFGGALGFNESVRQMLDLTTNIHRSVEDWDIARTDHLHALRTRPPAQVLSLITHARRISTRPWPRMMTAEAEALAMLGRHQEAAATMRSLADLVERGLMGDDLGLWKEDAIPFAQSWVHGSAGNENLAAGARDQVLRLAPEGSYQVLTNVLFHQDMCTVKRGGVDQGAKHAAEALDALPVAYRTNHVLETGRMVLRAVPREHLDHPTVRDLRAMLTVKA